MPSKAAVLGVDGKLNELAPTVFFNYTIPGSSSMLSWNFNTDVNGSISRTAWSPAFENLRLDGGMKIGLGSCVHTVGLTAPAQPSANATVGGETLVSSTTGSSVGFYYFGTRAMVHGNYSGFTWGAEASTPQSMMAAEVLTPVNVYNYNYQKFSPVPEPRDDVLYDTGDSPWAFQSVLLETPISGAAWSVNGVTVTTGMVTEAPSFEEALTFEEFVYQNGSFARQPRWDWTGEWGYGGPAFDSSNQSVIIADKDAQVTIPIPLNTSFYEIMGTTYATSQEGADHAEGQYDVLLKPDQRGRLQAIKANSFGPIQQSSEARSGNALSMDDVFAMSLLAWGPLDPTMEYTLKLDARHGAVTLGSIKYYSSLWGPKVKWPKFGAEGPNAKSDSKTAIIGGVVGAIAGAIIFGLLWWIFCTSKGRKTRARLTHDYDGEFLVDSTDPNATPFINGGRRGGKHPHSSRRLRSPDEVVEEEDAGGLEPDAEAFELARVPPRYNPTWASTRLSASESTALTVVSSTTSFHPAKNG